jgi:hypothetical protein
LANTSLTRCDCRLNNTHIYTRDTHHGHITPTALPTAHTNQQLAINTQLHPKPCDKIHQTLTTTIKCTISTLRTPALHLLVNTKRLLDLQPTELKTTKLCLVFLPTRPSKSPLLSLLLPLFPPILASRSSFPRPLECWQIFITQCALRQTKRTACVCVKKAGQDAHDERFWRGRRRHGQSTAGGREGRNVEALW